MLLPVDINLRAILAIGFSPGDGDKKPDICLVFRQCNIPPPLKNQRRDIVGLFKFPLF